MLALLASCGRGDPEPRGFKRVASPDGALEFRVPASWTEATDLNEVASLQAGDTVAEAYAVVIEDPRRAFASLDLAGFADRQMQQQVTRVGLANLGGPETLTVDGKPAVRYRLKGFHNAVEVVYLYTFVETPDRFLKVVAWSLSPNFEDNRQTLERVSASVRELQGLPEPDPAPTEVGDPAEIPPQDPGVIDRGDGT